MPELRLAPIKNVSEYASIAGEGLQLYDEAIWQKYADRVGRENLRGVFIDGKLAGGLAFYRMGQWYGGRVIPTAGVSGVAIAPSARGSGACKELLLDMLNELHREGIPTASLYASTQRLYRKVGFEQSGHCLTYSIPMSSLEVTPNARDLPVTRTLSPDVNILASLASVRGCDSNGNLERTPGLWERILEPAGATTSTYVLGHAGEPEGFAVLKHGKRSDGYPQTLACSDWVANTPRAMQRLIALISDHRSMCDSFQWNGGPQDPLLLAASEQQVRVDQHLMTLNRIVNVPAALEARGYPPSIEAVLEFQIADAFLPENEGNWRLEVTGGVGKASRGGDAVLRMSVADLVPLFTGMWTASQLAKTGRIFATNNDQLLRANSVFSGPSPWTSELF